MKTVKTILMILLIALSIYAVTKRYIELNSVNYNEVEYIVQENDTLWSIAEQYANEHQDLREYVYKIKQVNNIDSTLKVGQTIVIFK